MTLRLPEQRLALAHAFAFGFFLAGAIGAHSLGKALSVIALMMILAAGNAMLMVFWSRKP